MINAKILWMVMHLYMEDEDDLAWSDVKNKYYNLSYHFVSHNSPGSVASACTLYTTRCPSDHDMQA